MATTFFLFIFFVFLLNVTQLHRQMLFAHISQDCSTLLVRQQPRKSNFSLPIGPASKNMEKLLSVFLCPPPPLCFSPPHTEKHVATRTLFIDYVNFDDCFPHLFLWRESKVMRHNFLTKFFTFKVAQVKFKTDAILTDVLLLASLIITVYESDFYVFYVMMNITTVA